ncbi:hypothetical protein HDU79_004572 [Rhizoclosmatium sp. JEL0117]|nr:hypothetical protein HDU79_004572 [Rhizoclosmatium sp. JEL0117]
MACQRPGELKDVSPTDLYCRNCLIRAGLDAAAVDALQDFCEAPCDRCHKLGPASAIRHVVELEDEDDDRGFGKYCEECIAWAQNTEDEEDGVIGIEEERFIAAHRDCCLNAVAAGKERHFTFPQTIEGKKETRCVCIDCFKFLRIQNLFWRKYHYNDILRELKSDGITMALITLRRYLNQHGMYRRKRSIEDQARVDSMALECIKWYRANNGPSRGYRALTHWLHTERHIPIARVYALLKEYEPSLLGARKHRRLKRLNYVGRGPWEMCSFDQHDKFRFYGLFLHGGIDCYSRYLMWLKVWRTNRQGALVAFWYLESCRNYGNGNGIFRGTISDRGGENRCLGRVQTDIRFHFDPQASEEEKGNFHCVVQDSRLNQKVECFWGVFLRACGNDMLNELLKATLPGGPYNPRDIVQRKVFQYLYIPVFQKRLDEVRNEYNTTDKRSQPRRNLPSGYLSQPVHLMERASEFGGDDGLRVPVPSTFLKERMEELKGEGDFALFTPEVMKLLRKTRRMFTGDVECLAEVWPMLGLMVDYLKQKNLTGLLEEYEERDEHDERSSEQFSDIAHF